MIIPVKTLQKKGWPKHKKGYFFMTAIVTNPLSDIVYTNKPVGIYASFEEGEVPSISYLTVLDSSNNVVPFQWEDAIDPRSLTTLSPKSYGHYPDGSLRHGTIWIVVPSLAAGATAIYTIKVSESPVAQAFSQKVILMHNVNGVEDDIAVDNFLMTITSARSWLPEKIKINSVDMNPGYPAIYISILDNTYAFVDTRTLANVTVLSHYSAGNGVVFLDYCTKLTFKYNANITFVVRVRVWANGKYDVDCMAVATAAISDGVFNGISFLMQLDYTNIASCAKISNIPQQAWAAENATYQMLTGLRSVSLNSEYTGAGYADSNFFPPWSNLSDGGRLINAGGWQFSTPKTKAISLGVYQQFRLYFSCQYGQGNSASEILRCMNPIYTRATKDSMASLKRRLVDLTKYYIETAKNWIDINQSTGIYTDFGGAQSLLQYGLMKISQISSYTLATTKAKLDTVMTNIYGGGTAAGFVNFWASSSPQHGWEYISRDTSVLIILYKAYIAAGDSPSAAAIATYIHNLADAAVTMEVDAGSNGSMWVHGGIGDQIDNYNAEASALQALAASLFITSNSTRQATLNRIATRFATAAEFRNRTPHLQSAGGNSVDQSIIYPDIHYHGYQCYEAFSANDLLSLGITLPSARQYAFECSTPGGQIQGIGFEYQEGKRGFILTSMYIIALMARWGGNASDLQQAVSVFEHVLSRHNESSSGGIIENPLDNWGTLVTGITSPVECLSLIETVLSFGLF